MRDRKRISVLVVATVALIIIFFGDLDPGDPIPAVDCKFAVDDVEAQVTCFVVPVGTGSVLVSVLHEGSTPLEQSPVLLLPPDPASVPSFDLARYASMELLDHRNLVLVDPLGSERTAPAIDCDYLGVDTGPANILRCRDQMADRGLVAGWSLEAHIDHLVAVREALSEGRPWHDWDVVARGYGTQVALRLAAHDAGGVSALVLAGALPSDVAAFSSRAQAFPSSLAALQLQCSARGGCGGLTPLEMTTERIGRRLDTAPEPIEVTDDERSRTPIELDGDAFRSTVSYALETPTLPTILPWSLAAIDDAASEFGLSSDARDKLAGLVSAASDRPTVDTMLWWHLTCSEQIDLIAPETIESIAGEASGLIPTEESLQVCADWPRSDASVPTDEVARPILVFDNPIDPVGADVWTSSVAEANPGATSVPVTVTEWMPGVTSCTAEAIDRFLTEPGQIPDDPCLAEPLSMASSPVPIGGVRQIGGLGEAGAMAMGTFAVVLAIGMGAWIWLDAPPGPSRIAWIATASADVIAFLGVVSVLVFGSQPARLVAQPGWSWIFFGLPWLVMLMVPVALVATVQDHRTMHLGERWLARYGLLAVGIGVNLAAMVILGIIPGI